MNARRWLENTVLKLAFANTVYHKSAILLFFEAAFRESAVGILTYPESAMRITLDGLEEKF